MSTESQKHQILARALAEGLFTEEDRAVVFHDLGAMRARLDEIREAFPKNALHTVSVKANPLPGILLPLAAVGAGAEAASTGELALAERAGFAPERIVYDSPAKTRDEIRTVLERGIHLNADSLEELERIGGVLRAKPPKGPVGIRINPQIGLGEIPSTSVAGAYSKFGVPLREFRRDILQAFRRYPWLGGVHVHMGSQGYTIEHLAEGVASVVELALEAQPAVGFVDIGGGLPVAYRAADRRVTAGEYRAMLEACCPVLSDPPFRLLTEFGRYVQAAAGWAVTRIEYVRYSASGNTVVTHLGADMFLRACYDPGHWYHEVTLADRAGNPKEGEAPRYNIAGPLCFGGDIIRRDCPLPHPEPGDLLIIHDAGAYTLGMWSRYNSRPMPRVIGIDRETLTVLKEREEPEDLWNVWS